MKGIGSYADFQAHVDFKEWDLPHGESIVQLFLRIWVSDGEVLDFLLELPFAKDSLLEGFEMQILD